MKKILLLTVVGCLLMSAKALASFRLSPDNDGIYPRSIQDVGVRVITVGHTKSSDCVRGSSIAIYGVLTSTARATDVSAFVLIRSTAANPKSSAYNSAPNNGELLVPEVLVSTTSGNTFIEYDPPIVCPGGFSVQVTSMGTMASVFYQFMSTVGAGAARDSYQIPRDDYSKQKLYSSSFYGVKLASNVTPGGLIADGKGTETYDAVSVEKVVYGSTGSHYVVYGQTVTADNGKRRGFLYGWVASSGPVTNYVVFRDTNTTGNAAALLMPPIFYRNFTDTDRIWESIWPSANRNYVFRFPWPVIFEEGLTTIRQDSADKFRVLAKPAKTTY